MALRSFVGGPRSLDHKVPDLAGDSVGFQVQSRAAATQDTSTVLTTNKPARVSSGCRSMAIFSANASGSIPLGVRPSFCAAKGKTVGEELEEAWQS